MKTLAIVNGFGLGNATRCEPLLKELRGSIDIATSGNGLRYFRNKPYLHRLFELQPLSYGGTPASKGISLFGLLSAVPRVATNYLKNVRSVLRILASCDYDLILIDSDYTALIFRLFSTVPVVAINNSEIVIRVSRKKRPPFRVWPQLLIEAFDCLFHRLVPDLTLVPTLDDFSSDSKSLIPIPLLSRVKFTAARPRKHTHAFRILFIFSASSLSPDPSEFISQCPSEIEVDFVSASNRWNPDGSVRDVVEELRSADLIVTNAGLSTLSDAIALRTPILAIPIEGHCEQWVNAKLIEDLGIGEVATVENFSEKLATMRGRYDSYLEVLERIAPRHEFAAGQAVSALFRALALPDVADKGAESHLRMANQLDV